MSWPQQVSFSDDPLWPSSLRSPLFLLYSRCRQHVPCHFHLFWAFKLNFPSHQDYRKSSNRLPCLPLVPSHCHQAVYLKICAHGTKGTQTWFENFIIPMVPWKGSLKYIWIPYQLYLPPPHRKSLFRELSSGVRKCYTVLATLECQLHKDRIHLSGSLLPAQTSTGSGTYYILCLYL